MTWLSDVQDPKTSTVRAIKLNASKKGIILNTDDYDVFLFNSNKMVRFLKEALEVWVRNEGHFGKELVIIPTKALKEGFEVAHRDITQWWFDSSTGTYLAGEEGTEELTSNPFLEEPDSPPSNPLLVIPPVSEGEPLPKKRGKG